MMATTYMVTSKTVRESWQPRNGADHELVRTELESILKNSQFAHSKRYPAFLSYVVERTLNGEAYQIKERTIGIEVFGRSSDYDTNSDTVVRYTAGEVRKRLAMYYHDHDDTLIQISIPQGSYVPEFFHRSDPDQPAPLEAVAGPAAVPWEPSADRMPVNSERPTAASPWNRAVPALLVVLTLLLLLFGGFWYKTRHTPTTAVDRFWEPVIGDKGVALLVTGGVVFSPNPYSGVETAGKSDQYPFVSMQIAAALARVSGLLQHKGSNYQMLPANATTLSDLRDRPVVLIGGYNNDWTVRLLQNAPFFLGPAASPAIIERAKPQQTWKRDHSLPYSAADDFALVGRFHDTTTGNILVVIAGLGRNGTEAAALFLSEPHYMELLESRLGQSVGDHNVEAVLKISVVEGRTGAPSIEAVTVW